MKLKSIKKSDAKGKKWTATFEKDGKEKVDAAKLLTNPCSGVKIIFRLKFLNFGNIVLLILSISTISLE